MPSTEAGKRLLERRKTGAPRREEDFIAAIVSIEAEARKRALAEVYNPLGGPLADDPRSLPEHGRHSPASGKGAAAPLAAIDAIEAEAVAAERKRIRAAVEAAHRPGRSDINFRAVLAIIDGAPE